MRVVAAAARVQRSYEDGQISYPRTAARSVGPAGLAALSGVLRGRELPAAARRPPETTAGVRRPHEAIYPTTERLPGLAGGVPQNLLREADLLVDRLARAQLRSLMVLPIEVPDTRSLPEWARSLAWWRPAPDFPAEARSEADGTSLMVQGEFVAYEADEIAFGVLAREGLARPSSIAEHAHRAAERGFVDAEGLTPAGAEAIAGAPVSLREPEVARQIEGVIASDDLEAAQPGPPVDLIQRAFAVVPELAPVMEARLEKRGDDGRGGVLAPSASAVAAAPGDDGRDGVLAEFWDRRRRRAAAKRVGVQSAQSPDFAFGNNGKGGTPCACEPSDSSAAAGKRRALDAPSEHEGGRGRADFTRSEVLEATCPTASAPEPAGASTHPLSSGSVTREHQGSESRPVRDDIIPEHDNDHADDFRTPRRAPSAPAFHV